MSVIGSPGTHRHEGNQPVGALRVLRRFYSILTAPFRAFQAVRQAMTPASVSVLLFAIVTLNIIWGFPWTGLFSACVGMFVAGCLIHFLTLPSLETNFSLPNSAAQGQPFQVTIHAQNQSVLPALDFDLSFSKANLGRKRWFQRRGGIQPPYTVQQSIQHKNFLGSGDATEHQAVLSYHRRGIHPLPQTSVTGNFPFHLFKSRVTAPSLVSIAITPRPLSGEDAHTKSLLNNLGGWSHKLLSGDQLDYTGSREYEAGMSVRRWDFPSWARLGIPIVREFQSPSIQQVFLIIDTAFETNTKPNKEGIYPALEQMLSLATTAIHDLAKQTVKIQLFVTDENFAPTDSSRSFDTGTDSESMLIKLAAAKPVDQDSGNQQIIAAHEIAGRSPTLVLTTRSLPELQANAFQSCTVMRTAMPKQSQTRPESNRKRRKTPPLTQPV
ncbi:DUF58 domain-containing protein [bacterium]|nr:DUF58 domain-containing protein [bacterium]